MNGWSVIGEVGVDSGRVVVVDLAYTNLVPDDDIEMTNIPFPENPNVDAGVIVDSGYGDGVYPVEARYVDGRVAEIRVRFIGDLR